MEKAGLRAKLSLVLMIAGLLLAGCQMWTGLGAQAGTEEPSSAVTAPTTVAATGPSREVTPTAAEPATTATVEAPATPTATATVTGTPLPTPTPAPYICPFLQGRTEAGALQSAAMGEQVRYLVHLPPCYDAFPDRAFPTLYLFHGWPLNEWHWDNLGIDEWSDDWVSRGLVGPFIVVLPGAGSDGRYVHSSGGPGSFEGFVVDELVPQIDGAYRTLREPVGRAIGGISRGGVWALEIAMRHRDLFASAGGHSPALALNNPLPQYDPFLIARDGLEGLRIYLDAGDADWARASTIRLRDLLIEMGVDVTYEVHAGGHVDALWSGGIPAYLQWYVQVWPESYEALPVWAAAAPLDETVQTP